ncbi:DUF2164 domain-containing protein [Paraglaciecola aestuariivivens]
MSEIQFSPAQKEQLVQKLQNYFNQELDLELAQFDADFLLDFIAKEMGKTFYNQGVYDAQAVLDKNVDALSEAIYQLEKY